MAYFPGGGWCHSWYDGICQKWNPRTLCISMGVSPGSAVLSVRNDIVGETRYKLSRGSCVHRYHWGKKPFAGPNGWGCLYLKDDDQIKDTRRRDRSVMAHTFLQESTGWLLLSFYLTTSFKYKFVLIPLDFQAFLFSFFNLKERLTGGYFCSSQHMTPTMNLLSLHDTGRTVSTSVSLLEQKIHKHSDVWSPFSLSRP